MKFINTIKAKVDNTKDFIQPLIDKHLDEIKEMVSISNNSSIFIKEKLNEIKDSVDRIMISVNNINYNIKKRSS